VGLTGWVRLIRFMHADFFVQHHGIQAVVFPLYDAATEQKFFVFACQIRPAIHQMLFLWCQCA
jgi:hypothetical protein